MAAPVNIDAPNAIDLVLDIPVAQDVHDAGTTYTVWYKYTAVVGDKFLSLASYGDFGTAYDVVTRVFKGPDTAPELIIINSINRAALLGVFPGETYYFSFASFAPTNPTPAILNLLLERDPSLSPSIPLGTVLISSDRYIPYITQDFLTNATAFVDPDTGIVLSFIRSDEVEFSAGEMGDILPSGKILFGSFDFVNPALDAIKYQLFQYDGVDSVDLELAISFPFTGTFYSGLFFHPVRAQQQLDKFCVAFKGNRESVIPDSPAQFVFIQSDGTVEGKVGTAPWVLPRPAGMDVLTSAVVLNDGKTLLYTYEDINDSLIIRSYNQSTIYKYDLETETLLSDFVAAVPDFGVTDILVFADDTVLVLYYRSETDPIETFARLYDINGNTIRTFPTLGLPDSDTTPRLGYGVDQTSFWLFQKIGTQTSTLRNFRLSDGVVLHQHDLPNRQGGYGSAQINSVTELGNEYKFTLSQSCPIIVLQFPSVPEPEPIGPTPCVPCATVPMFVDDSNGNGVNFVCE